MSPTLKTLAMAIAAVVLGGFAAASYPWPEAIVQSEMVGQPLFEDFDPGKIRIIKIVRFNKDSSKLEPLELRFQGDSWVIPSRKNFPVTNINQNSITVNALLEREVLLEATDEQEKHREFGVVDPLLSNSIADRSALGTKVIFEGATGNQLANLIVGKVVKGARPNDFGEVQHYAVIPGQPAVYVIYLNPRAFPTDFRAWINPNLLSIPFRETPVDILITNSRIAPDEFGKKTPELVYRANIQGTSPGGLKLGTFEMANDKGAFQAATIDADLLQLKGIDDTLRAIYFSDVRKKAASLAAGFREPSSDLSADTFEALKDIGFNYIGMKFGSPQFETSNGRFEARFAEGVRLSILFGAIATEAISDQDGLNRYVMVSGEFDESLFPPLPEKSEPTGDAEKDEAANKEYLRAVKKRDELLKGAKAAIKDFNEVHADWVYLVSDSICSTLVPEIDLSKARLIEGESRGEAEQQPDAGEKKDAENAKAVDEESPANESADDEKKVDEKKDDEKAQESSGN